MKFLITLLLFVFSVSACAPLTISDPSDKPGETRGSLQPLASYLSTDDEPVKLIFLHGVGDHCPGYALGPGGWLSDSDDVAKEKLADIGLTPLVSQYEPPDNDEEYKKRAKIIGLKPLGPQYSQKIIFNDEFLWVANKVHPKRDVQSYVVVTKRKFEYKAKEADRAINVEAIEITWSPLTQWIKTNYLGYDLRGNVKDPNDPSLDCVRDAPKEFASPPPRALANSAIKEQVLDRDLADALIYIGPFGQVIQRGVANALCRALTDKPITKDDDCLWPEASIAEHTRYIFVTHSLGSRILFDVLLGLDGQGEAAPVFQYEYPTTFAFVDQMMANTPVIYMMANQVALLGLAKLSPLQRSDGQMLPYIVPNTIVSSRSPEKSSRASLAVEQLSSKCMSTLCRFAAKRQLARIDQDKEPRTLDIVAFSDSSDLLSWGIPEWYVRPAEDEAKLLSVRVANVYVSNSFHWFGMVEWPIDAHGDYFYNPYVLKTIKCGANQGALEC